MQSTASRRWQMVLIVSFLLMLPGVCGASLSGWVSDEVEGGFAYAASEANFVYITTTGEPTIWCYNMNAQQWQADVSFHSWMYYQWPWVYAPEYGSWFYFLEPAGGIWVFHCSTGQWTSM